MTKKTTAKYHDISNFQEILGRDTRETILAMDAAGDDPASQKPEVEVDINHVGCKNKKTYLSLLDPFSQESQMNLFATLQVGIALPKTVRGLHVSRLNDSIARTSSDRTYKNVCDFGRALALDIKNTQDAISATVKIKANYIAPAEVETLTGLPSKNTQDHFLLLGEVTIGNGFEKNSVGLEFSHLTSCPCVQQTIRHAKGNGESNPVLTHSQRVITNILLSEIERDLDVAELLKCIDSVLFLTRDTLPRPGEATLVFRSHEQPQFIEDVVRNTAERLYSHFGKQHSGAMISIESRSLESIHSFDLVANLRTSMAAMKDALEERAPRQSRSPRKDKSRWSAS